MKSTIKLNDIIQPLLAKYRFFLVDLDNTLYNENDYLFGAYKAIAAQLSATDGINKETAERFLVETFLKEGRHLLFNAFCKEFGVPDEKIKGMLNIMRSYQPTGKIALYPVAEKLLEALSESGKNIFIVTNGNLQQQQNKVGNIDWKGYDSKIQFIFAAEHLPKPAPDSFHYLVKNFGVKAEETIMIGDTDTDESYAKNCGIAFQHINKLLGTEIS